MVLVLLVTAGGVIMGIAINRSGTSLLLHTTTAQLIQEQRVVSTRLTDILDNLQRDVEFLYLTPSVRRVIAATRDDTREADLEPARKQLQEVFTALVNRHPWYAQVRLIGVADGGRELVRVNQVNGRAVAVPDARLQRKGGRDYFQAGLASPPGEVFFSAINLNREEGQIVEPHQPMLRAGVAIALPQSGTLGVLIINMDMARVFAAARELVSPNVTLYVANGRGDYLYHPDPGRTFGFDLGQRYRIQDDFPDLPWPLAGDVPELVEQRAAPGNRDPLMARVAVLDGPGGELLLGLALPQSYIDARLGAARRQNAGLVLPFIAIGIVAVIWVVRVIVDPLSRVTWQISRYTPGVRPEPMAELSRHDEVGRLAQTFSYMVDRIEQQLSELEEQNDRFLNLFQTAVDAIVIVDRDGTVEAFNAAAERLFGYRSREVVGRNVGLLVASADGERYRDVLARYLAGEELKLTGIGREVNGRHKDGRPLPVYLSISEFTLQGRRKFTGILHDLSRGVLRVV